MPSTYDEARMKWWSFRDGWPMLKVVLGVPTLDFNNFTQARDKRKLRLFLAAICRMTWDRLIDSRSRDAVVVAEEYADGKASESEQVKALIGAFRAWQDDPRNNAAGFARYAIHDVPMYGAERVVRFMARNAAFGPQTDYRRQDRHPQPERRFIPGLLRELFNNPFISNWQRSPCICDQGSIIVPGKHGFRDMRRQQCNWCLGRSWKVPLKLNSIVIDLAQAIYNERAWDRMPILADALEDAGNTDPNVLRHCRSCDECGGQGWYAEGYDPPEQCTCDWCGGTGIAMHFRGCWVVDSIFGRN